MMLMDELPDLDVDVDLSSWQSSQSSYGKRMTSTCSTFPAPSYACNNTDMVVNLQSSLSHNTGNIRQAKRFDFVSIESGDDDEVIDESKFLPLVSRIARIRGSLVDNTLFDGNANSMKHDFHHLVPDTDPDSKAGDKSQHGSINHGCYEDLSERGALRIEDCDQHQKQQLSTSLQYAVGKKRKKTTKSRDSEENKATHQLRKEQVLKEKQDFEEKQKEAKHKRQVLKLENKFDKLKKRLVQDAVRTMKPAKCMKHISVTLDVRLMNEQFGAVILEQLQLNEIKYEVDNQVQPNIITFWRNKIIITETGPGKLATDQKEVIEEDVLLYVPLMDFLPLVDNYHKEKQGLAHGTCTLLNFAEEKRRQLGDYNLTLLVQGIDTFHRSQKAEASRAYRQRVKQNDENLRNDAGGSKKRKKSCANVAISIGHMEVEEALLRLQLETGICVHFAESNAVLAKLVVQFAKALAQRPYKQDRMKSGGFNIFLEKSRGIRVLPDGTGLTNVWRQQLQQFKNVSVDTANAIMAIYPSPRALINAYKACSTERQKESLLEDIVVRRGAGVISTSRRVGKELSCKLHIFMTSIEQNEIIK